MLGLTVKKVEDKEAESCGKGNTVLVFESEGTGECENKVMLCSLSSRVKDVEGTAVLVYKKGSIMRGLRAKKIEDTKVRHHEEGIATLQDLTAKNFDYS